MDFSNNEICARRLSHQARCWIDGYTSRPKLMAIEPLMEEFQSVQGSYDGQCGLKLDGDAMCWNTTELSADLDNDGFNVMVDCDDDDDFRLLVENTILKLRAQSGWRSGGLTGLLDCGLTFLDAPSAGAATHGVQVRLWNTKM